MSPEEALAIFDAGWAVLDMPAGKKFPPPDNRTGYRGINYTRAEVAAIHWSDRSLAVRATDGVVGFDFDLYKPGTRERANELGQRYGPLPKTMMTTARDDMSGIRFYRVPVGTTFPGVLCEGVEVIQPHHRYAMLAGLNPATGTEYQVIDEASGDPCAIWDVADLPELPWSWINGLADTGPSGKLADLPATASELVAFCEAHTETLRLQGLGGISTHLAAVTVGGRHDALIRAACWGLREARAGWYPADDLLDLLAEWWDSVMRASGETGRLIDASSEFTNGLLWAVAEAQAVDEWRIAELRAKAQPAQASTMFYGWSHLFPAPVPLIEGVLDLGAVTLLYARWGCFKSFLAIDWAMSVATGKDWHGRIVAHPGAIAVLGYEAPVSIHRRAHAWAAHHGVEPGASYHLAGRNLPRLSNPTAMTEMADELDRLGVVLVVVDTIARGGVGADMNTHEADLVFQGLHALASPQRTVVGIAHAGKDATRGVRGFSSQEDQADLIYRLDRERDSTTQQPKGPATLTNPKAKDRETISPLHFDLVHSPALGLDERVLLPTVKAATATTPEDRVEMLVKAAVGGDWLTVTMIKDRCKRPGVLRPDIGNAIERLIELEYLERSAEHPEMVRRRDEIEYLE